MLVTPAEVSKMVKERQDAMNQKTDIITKRVQLAKNVQAGQVVYFLERVCVNGVNRHIVSFGVVESIFHDGLNIVRYYPFRKKIVTVLDDKFKDEIPSEEIRYSTRWYKLPKGYSKDPVGCRLMETSYTKETDEKNEKLKEVKLSDPDAILKAIQDGLLVKNEDIDHRYFEVEMEKQNGFRVIPKSDFQHDMKYISLPTFFRFSMVYTSYEAANEEKNREENEFKRESSLSDEEWSKEQIVDTILFWKHAHSKTDEECAKIISFLFEQPNIEDLEIKIEPITMSIAYKYCKNKCWVHVDSDKI